MKEIKNNFGKCRICGQNKQLTFEHVPPRVTLNRTTKYVSIPFEEWSIDSKPKGKILQGGIGYYSLCKDCNTFLGINYVKAYEKWVISAVQLIMKYDFDFAKYIALKQEPLKIIKQIISMFLAINDDWYLDAHPELAEFVRNPLSNALPDKFQVFTYLNHKGQYRYFKYGVAHDPVLGVICVSEIAFPPFGYVLTYNFDGKIERLQNITHFKNYSPESKHDLDMSLHKLETNIPFCPLDYRIKTEL